MPTYTYYCEDGHETELQHSHEGRPQFIRCTHQYSDGQECPLQAEYHINAPMVLKQSYPDGLRGQKDSWRKMRDAAKLNVEIARTPAHKRAELEKERKKLNVNIKKDAPGV